MKSIRSRSSDFGAQLVVFLPNAVAGQVKSGCFNSSGISTRHASRKPAFSSATLLSHAQHRAVVPGEILRLHGPVEMRTLVEISSENHRAICCALLCSKSEEGRDRGAAPRLAIVGEHSFRVVHAIRLAVMVRIEHFPVRLAAGVSAHRISGHNVALGAAGSAAIKKAAGMTRRRRMHFIRWLKHRLRTESQLKILYDIHCRMLFISP